MFGSQLAQESVKALVHIPERLPCQTIPVGILVIEEFGPVRWSIRFDLVHGEIGKVAEIDRQGSSQRYQKIRVCLQPHNRKSHGVSSS